MSDVDDTNTQSADRSELDPADAENGVRLRQQPHQSVGFWHPKMGKVRKHVILSWLKTVVILLVAIMGVLSLFWGVLYRVNANLRAIIVHVVDFDGQVAPYDSVTPIVGPQVVQLARETVNQPGPSLGYTILPPSQFNNDPMAVRQAVYDWQSYAAIIVNPNATAMLQSAVATGNASYDPTGAVQVIIQTARDPDSYEDFILPEIEQFVTQFSAVFGPQWAKIVMSNSSLTRDNLISAQAAINPGVVPLQIDLRPFQPFVALPAISIGLIYLIIMAFFSFSFFLPIHMRFIAPQGHPPLHFWQLIVWRWLATVVAYLFISLAYSLVSRAFQIPFWPPPWSSVEPPPSYGATAYGYGTFPVYWMLNFVGMMALGLACENVAMIVGQPWTALWLIFWVITNVSTSFYSIDLAPGFYHWGYAWPLHHIVEASRQLLFDLTSHIGLNFGVLFAWVAVNTALFPLCCYFMRWKGEYVKRVEEKSQDRFKVKTEDGEDVEVRKEAGQKPPIRKRGFMRGV